MMTDLFLFIGSILLVIASVIGGFVLLWRVPEITAARRVRAGKCADCGYDLAHAPSRICPECGTEF